MKRLVALTLVALGATSAHADERAVGMPPIASLYPAAAALPVADTAGYDAVAEVEPPPAPPRLGATTGPAIVRVTAAR